MKTFIFFSLLFITTITKAQINLVKNPGFEYEFVNWGGEDMGFISPFDKKTGRKCAVINQYVGAEWKAIDQTINIAKNTYAIEFSVWIKSESIEEQKEAYKVGAAIAEFRTLADKSIISETFAQVKGTSDWINYKKTVKVPAEAKKVRIMLALAQTNGSIYFDDVKAIALSEEEYLKLNPITLNPEK